MNKRDFLKSMGLTLAYFLAKPSLAGKTLFRPADLSHEDIIRMSLLEGLHALNSGKLSSFDFCSSALRQAALFKSYNIFTQISSEYALYAASAIDAKRKQGKPLGALMGAPYALKDSIDMLEYYTSAGHPQLMTFKPSVDADLVKRCKEEDAVCIGKTQLAPLSLWWSTENPMTGNTGNPFNIAYKTGGSSGGSGAAVAARIVPFSIAEDSAGSVRVPAALNGVLGFRPTTGRWPTAGTMPLGFADTLGPIARTVADIKLLDGLFGLDRPRHTPSSVIPSELRIGFQIKGFFDDLHPWVSENIEQTIGLLAKAKVKIVELKGLPAEESFDIASRLLMSDFPGQVARYFNRHGVWNRSSFGLMQNLPIEALKKALLPIIERAPTGENYFVLVEKLLAMRKSYNHVLTDNRIDALLYTTTKVPNTPNDGGNVLKAKGPYGEDLPERQLGANMLFAPCQKTPSLSLYSGMDKAGLPLSITLDGYSGQDRRLLDIAEALEKILPALSEPKAISQLGRY